jgi:hypothetical protein
MWGKALAILCICYNEGGGGAMGKINKWARNKIQRKGRREIKGRIEEKR